MYNFLAIFLGKAIIKFMNLLKFNASVFPGKFVLIFFPKLLEKVKYPKLTIMVTGSAGKGSTAKLVTELLKKFDYKVILNESGSNLINAFTTMVIKNSNLKGNMNADALVYEVDERYLKIITKYLKPNYLIINNITRDQPPRQGNFDLVFDEIKKGIDESVHLIVNGDDPITRRFSLYHKGKITYFGISKNFMSKKEELNNIKDNLYCPNCRSKLEFEFYHYGSVGSYACPSCDFKRSCIDYEITNINKDDMTITINKKYNIQIENYLLFNLYNICACFSLLGILKLNLNKSSKYLSNIDMDKKIFNEIIINNRKYVSLNCKAENNATYNLALLYTSLDDNKKTIVIGLKEISRRYNYFDLSWLWDISFELLEDNNVDKVICAGPYRYDIATRINYAKINKNKIIILEDFNELKETLDKETTGTVYGILNFDYVKPFISAIKEEKL